MHHSQQQSNSSHQTRQPQHFASTSTPYSAHPHTQTQPQTQASSGLYQGSLRAQGVYGTTSSSASGAATPSFSSFQPWISSPTPLTAPPPLSPSIHAQDNQSFASAVYQQVNPNYNWLFEDSEFSARYDVAYSNIIRQYDDAARNLHIVTPDPSASTAGGAAAAEPTAAQLNPTTISYSNAEQIAQILLSNDSLIDLAAYNVPLDARNLEFFVELVWSTVQPITFFIHRPSFDQESQSPYLLATMVLLGMSLVPDRNIRKFATANYMNVVMALKKVLMARQTFQFEDDLGLLQAFCLLMRYERHINAPNDTENYKDDPNNDKAYAVYNRVANNAGEKSSAHHQVGPSYQMIESKWLIGRFMWLLLPRASQYDNNNIPQPFKYGRVGSEGYVFNQGISDTHQAWLEWSKYEACKRATHFALYCDCVHMLNENSNTAMQLTIFDVDTHMPAPEVLWNISNHYDFFRLIGTESIVRSVPYLSLIKSILRLPGPNDVQEEIQSNWSIFVFTMVLYGLLSVARAMTGSATNLEDMVKKLNSAGSNGHWSIDFVEKRIQVRLSRGFDIWNQYFDGASGLRDSHYAFASPPNTSTSLNNSKHYNIRNVHSAGSTSSEGSSPDHSGTANKLENASLMGHLQVQLNSDLFMDYVLLILLHNHAAQLLINDDLQMVLLMANGLPYWTTMESPVNVLDNVDFSVYRSWVQSAPAKSMVTTACLYLVRATAGHRLLTRDRAENLMLGLVTYYAVLVVWLYSLTLPQNPAASYIHAMDIHQDPYLDSQTMKLNVKKIVNDSTRYLHYIWGNTRNTMAPNDDIQAELITSSNNGKRRGSEFSGDTVIVTSRSVVALGCWLLASVQVGQFKTGGQTLFELYQRFYVGMSPGNLMAVNPGE